MQLTIDPIAHDSIAQLGLIETGLTETGFAEALGTHRLSNFISSVNAYADMSPDLSVRKDVNTWMVRRDRQTLDLTTWSQLFGHPSHPVLAFIYKSFGDYSGLDFSRTRPNDSLNTHLKFPLVCWFDWTITFCENFFQAFDLDLSDRFDEADFHTIGELINFLVTQVDAAQA